MPDIRAFTAVLLAILVYLVLTPSMAIAQQGKLASDDGSATIIKASVLEDPQGQLSLADVRAREGEFTTLEVPALPQSKSIWWMRLEIAREPGAAENRVLIAGIPTLLDIKLYTPSPTGYLMFEAGTRVPLSARPLPAWEPRFAVRLDQEFQVFYLRIQDPAELELPLLLLSNDALEARDRDNAIWMSLFLGLMFGLLVYNLFLFLSLGDPAYGWYVLSGTSLLMCFLMITGWGGLYLWQDSTGFEVISRLLLPSVWGAAYWQFIARFFALEQGYPRLNRLVQVFSFLFVVLALCSLTGERYYVSLLLHSLAITALPCVFVIGIVRWKDGFRPAGVFMLGQLALMSPIFSLAMRVAGLIGPSPLIENGLLIGAAAETLLFAVALAQRIRGAEQARDNAQNLLLAERQLMLEQLAANNTDLERRVSDRTHELERANQRLEEQKLRLAEEAGQDNLTGLANRRTLAERYSLTSALAARNGTSYALLLIDLDGFKGVNDSAGHDEGDQVLQALAPRLQALIRAGDTLARVGGDEFVVLMTHNTSTNQARGFAGRLLEAIAQPIDVGESKHALGASIGIALSTVEQHSLSDMMRQADLAMYAAKRGNSTPRISIAEQQSGISSTQPA